MTTPISPWSVPHGRLQPCPAREAAPTRPPGVSGRLARRCTRRADRRPPCAKLERAALAALAGRAAEHPVDPTAEAGLGRRCSSVTVDGRNLWQLRGRLVRLVGPGRLGLVKAVASRAGARPAGPGRP